MQVLTDDKPSFPVIVQKLSHSFEKMADYLDVGAFTNLTPQHDDKKD